MDAEGVIPLLTPQEVSSHAFTKAVMGGYNMAMVDEFLDELTDDYTALYKENAALKAKMKVLVEKVEDYRATEDSMRATLLTAQKMADSIVREAEAKRDQLLRDAETQAQEKLGALRREAEEAQERIRMGQRELSSFTEQVKAVCEKELMLLDQLPAAPVTLAQPEPTLPTREIEEKILSSFRETEAKEAQPDETPESAAPAAEETPAAPQAEPVRAAQSYADPFVSEGDEPTRKIELDELKFGRNYNRPE